MDFYISNSMIHKRGCFSARKIFKNETFIFPVIIQENIDSEYHFPWNGRKIKSIVIGPVTFCNSSDDPNLKILSIDKNKLTKTFVAIKDIDVNNECFLKYKI